MNGAVPNAVNKQEIKKALNATFSGRRAWIKATEPDCTTILQEYKHLGSYEGEMVCYWN